MRNLTILAFLVLAHCATAQTPEPDMMRIEGRHPVELSGILMQEAQKQKNAATVTALAGMGFGLLYTIQPQDDQWVGAVIGGAALVGGVVIHFGGARKQVRAGQVLQDYGASLR